MAPISRDGDVVASFSGKWISGAHTIAAYSAFVGALIVGIALHYEKIVQNEHWGYPEEWFPSVSATIGDRYPERSVFQLFIAITSGPRFALVALWYVLTKRPNSSLSNFVAGVGIFRTLTCGGWTYVTSTDDHNWHDIFMISYLVATVPWTLGCLALSPQNPQAIRWRKRFATAFFGTIVPLIYFFIQHKVHKVAGAYTIYAFFEWALVLLDVGFDAVTMLDFDGVEVVVKDIRGITRGADNRLADAVLEKQKAKPAAQVISAGFSWPVAFDAAADVYNGFVFWSMLTSLGLCVWYFPLWHMGISGFEAFIVCTLTPYILGPRAIRNLFFRNVRVLHLLSLSGLLAWLLKDPTYRLFAVAFGVGMSCLAWVCTFGAAESKPAYRLESRISAFCLGLIMSSIAKFAWHTNNPIWPVVNETNGGWNKIGLLFAVLSILRSTRDDTSDKFYPVPPRTGGKPGSPALAGLGFAGVMFSMHSLLSDSSTMTLWVWSGYPVNGPLASPHGAYTIIAMGVGLLFGVMVPGIARSWTFYGIGSIGAAALVAFDDWTGYYGALAIATYIMAIAPVLIRSAVHQRAYASTFGFGFLIYNILVLAHVWVVAYAFVPGGPLMREHTDWVVAVTMLCIGAGVYEATARAAAPSKKPKKPAQTSPTARRQRGFYIYILGGLQLLAIAVAYLRFPTYDYTPYHPDSNVLTAGIWTVHFSLDNDMWDSSRRMAYLLKNMELDVIGLLESDLQRVIMGNRDTTQYLAEELGMYVDYGPGPDKHTWGAALLSKFPIVNSTHHLLPSPVGELAPAIHATLDAYGELVDVVVFHSGQEEDPEDRRLQTEYLSNLMGSVTTRPVILLSYLVTTPKQGNYNTYVGEVSGMRDIDHTDWDRWCEYVLYKGLKRIGYARLSRGTITDTELQVGKFVVGQPEGSDEHISEDHVPEDMRFPALFRGEGVKGHRYHVFDEPRYYA
ncbi:calcofluor white hypersensitive protein-like protein [Eremomyces bilateralis CBS 781.70]|uniref:Calcofluor white hypersensitive protein-like protein n=1 Tax=Eremomyces bilateralis CBS 781.70 TaxID=1392243 RepID=A0A6G1FY62_9PEZI|nr:calcofluor white hypersensitive protein-like protein [Eremomyces bilateralis CBS 781.70]KAF1810652.1 calcofluor white hypersensitive protein-like protein [Eremomyces bilateralis CBS 781.70]